MTKPLSRVVFFDSTSLIWAVKEKYRILAETYSRAFCLALVRRSWPTLKTLLHIQGWGNTGQQSRYLDIIFKPLRNNLEAI